MKKFFIALSVLVALFLTVAPVQALIGMPDDVPGSDVTQAFFVVEVGTAGLDTLVIFQEVGGIGTSATGTAAGRLHWIIRDRRSNHLKDQTRKYTAFDVDAVSVRDLIATYCTAADKAALLTTLGGVDCYVGYIEWQNNSTTLTSTTGAAGGLITAAGNNMIAKQYLVDLVNGRTSGVNLAAREAMVGVASNFPYGAGFDQATASAWDYNWLAVQYQTFSAGANEGDFVGLAPLFADGVGEAFNAQALAASEQRESSAVGVVIGAAAPQVEYQTPTSFLLAPRFYLYDANAENFIFIWKSTNAAGVGVTGKVPCTVYDTVEYGVSTYVDLPDELNIIDMQAFLPPYFLTTYPSAGWIRIPFNDADTGTTVLGATGWRALDFLGYSWQYASGAASTNWAALFQVARWVDWADK